MDAANLLTFFKTALSSPRVPDGPSNVEQNAEFQEVLSYLNMVRKSVFTLAKGNIDFNIEQRGFLAGCLKELQSNLRHLTWYAERLGTGDFEQSIDFMGEFSRSFNKLNSDFKAAIEAVKDSEASLLKMTEELHVSEERWKLAIACTQDGIWDINLNERRAYFASRTWEILRRPINMDYITFNESYWLRYVHPDDRDKVADEMLITPARMESPNKRHYSEFRVRGGDGLYRWLGVHHMLLVNEKGTPYRFVGACEDIQEKRQREDAIRMQATHDKLTGLPNRYLYADRLEQQMVMAKRNESSLILVVWDLDGFKQVNDVYGHLAGDALLVAVAEMMRSCLREMDTLARFGGDEFIMLLSSGRGQEMEVALNITKRIFKALKSKINVGSADVIVGASCGIGFFPEHSIEPDELFNFADKALYFAKRNGKNKAQIWSPEISNFT
jgi:diguanylate cyclase (GGDEF)-like protein